MLYMPSTLLIFAVIFVDGKGYVFQHTFYPIKFPDSIEQKNS